MMSKIDEAFETKVRPVLESGAYSITWDGCHKIYVLMDEDEHRTMKEFGYHPLLRVKSVDEALQILRRWFDEACFLRFVCSVDAAAGFKDLIAQGEFNEDVRWWVWR